MKRFYNVSYGPLDVHKLDIYLPECEEFPVFLFYHGGGIEAGDKSLPDYITEYFTSNGIALISADYRMYPDYKFPDYIEDAALAAAWVKDNISSYGKSKGLFVGGISAGGYISLMLCFDRHFLAKHGMSCDDITGFIHDCGQPTTHYNICKYEYKVHSLRVIIDEKAPIYHIDDNVIPTPMYFIISDDDLPCRYQQTQLMLEAMKTFGYDMENKIEYKLMHGTHGHYIYMQEENGESVYGKLLVPFIKKFS